MKALKRVCHIALMLCLCLAALAMLACASEPPTEGTQPPPGAEAPHIHKIVEHEGKEPTCTEDGYRPYCTCASCDSYTTYTVIPATGHDYTVDYQPNGDEVHSRFCKGCSQTIDVPHEWQMSEIIKQPTCVNAGLCFRVCACGAKIVGELPATGEHTEGDWIVSVEAGALTEGTESLCCSVCRTTLDERKTPPQIESMPILFMEGNYWEATAQKNDVQMTVRYVHPDGTTFSSYALIHVQGATSAGLPKKNYTLKLYKDAACTSKFKVDIGWGKESKYCMKANWVDYTQARNVVSCRIWRDIVQTRDDSAIKTRLLALSSNAGGIDGFPMAVYMNGEFFGLYTMNIPKDEWMFGMDDVETEALISASGWNTDFSTLVGEFTLDKYGDYTSGEWELKYFGTEKTTGSSAWVTESFNNLIRFCQENEGDAFKAGISEYMDVDAAIDYLIYFYAIYMRDNTCKNVLWATYDGKVWIPSLYDQDGTFGMAWDGYRYAPTTADLPIIRNGKVDTNSNLGTGNFLLWDRMWDAFLEEILVRYKELRATVLTSQHIRASFEEFRSELPASVYVADREAWASERAEWWTKNKYDTKSEPYWYALFDYDYIYSWVDERLEMFDAHMQQIHDTLYLPTGGKPILN